MINTVRASQAKNNFGEVIRRVYEKGEVQIIERAGMPVVAIVSIRDIQRLYPEQVKDQPRLVAGAEREQAVADLWHVMREMQTGNDKYSEEEIEKDVMNAVNEVRYGKYKA